jgi:outer membrane protein TolC
LPLEEAIRTALQNNRQIQASLLEVTKAVQSTAELGASRYPRFNVGVLSGMALNPMHLTIPEGTIGIVPGIGPLPAHDASITTPRRITALIHGSAAQPLSQLYKIGLGLRASRIGEDLARENLRQSRQETAQQVRQAYYQIAQTQAQLAAAETSLQFLTELSALMERRLAEETVLRSDALSIKAKTAQQRYQLLALRNAAESGKESLNRLLGRDLETGFSVEFQPLPTLEEIDLAAARGKAVEQRPEIRKAKLQASKAELDIRRERAEYLPDLSLQLSYFSFANINFAPQNFTSAGFLFEWQPFDWGQKHHHLEQLRGTAKQADLTSADAEQQVLLDVGIQYRKLAEARALLDAQAAVQEAEREKLRVVMRRFEEKAALTADVLQQQAALAQADSQFSQALAGFWTARAAFYRALGEE